MNGVFFDATKPYLWKSVGIKDGGDRDALKYGSLRKDLSIVLELDH